jgi:hypothetical protein
MAFRDRLLALFDGSFSYSQFEADLSARLQQLHPGTLPANDLDNSTGKLLQQFLANTGAGASMNLDVQ